MTAFKKWFFSQNHWCGFSHRDHKELGVEGEMYLSDGVYCGGWSNPDIPPANIRKLAPKKWKEYYDFYEKLDRQSPDSDYMKAWELYHKAFGL